jgi:hypothetical protein
MHVDYTPEQKALRTELRAYFAKLVTPELRSQLHGLETSPLHKQLIRQMGRDGWLGVGWPKEYGGQGRTAIEQLIWFEEARRAGAPIPFVTLNTVGPTLMNAGSEAQKQKFLRAILAGEIHFAIWLLRARRGHRPRVAEDQRGARRRPLRGERHQDLHERRRRRRLRLAGGSHRSSRAQAQGHLDPDRRHEVAGLLVLADLHGRRRPHQHDLLRERPGAGREHRGPGEHGLAPDHDAAEPRADRTRGVQQLCAAALRRHRRVGAQDRGRGRPAGRREAVGAVVPSARRTRGSRR